MRVLVAMSGGVDSSVAAAMLVDDGHEVVGATMKLWGGSSDSGCCSVADVEDARRVAQQLGIAHHVFNFTDDFDRHVVGPYVDAHVAGETPNPCIECNRHLKFDRFHQRARQLGFDAIATGHHARIVRDPDGTCHLERGADERKDQSYVLSMLTPEVLRSTLFPIGDRSKREVRAIAEARGLRTADKPDSQDVCFILATAGGRETFLGDRIPLRPASVVDRAGTELGRIDAVELVTIGQRRGLGGVTAAGGERLYAVDVDVAGGVVTVGTADELDVDSVRLGSLTWTGDEPGDGSSVMVQSSAHGTPSAAIYRRDGIVELTEPGRKVAPGQTVAIYDGDRVLGAGIARRPVPST